MAVRYLDGDDALAAFAEVFGVSLDRARDYVKDWTLLKSALDRPINAALYEDADLTAQGATLLWGLVKNHAFHDGNKRTAYVCARVFLEFNGWQLVADEEDEFTILVDVAENRATVADVEAWLAPRISLIPYPLSD